MAKPTVKIEDLDRGIISIDKNNGKGPRGGINAKAHLDYLAPAKEEYDAVLAVVLEIESRKAKPKKKGFFAKLFGK